ncbi:hypothetical protein [Taibaiella helva]|uniref:hypothetical protein n=1 Tax=Taibaiella helva TaxID=2301235 RepID=UPI0013001B7D|nr:hypothetical protein [Taibaiella helva]
MFIVWILAIIGALFLVFRFLSANNSQIPIQNTVKIHDHPIRQSFENLNLNQRMSIINMLRIIGTSDLPHGNADKELQYLNSTIGALGVRAVECVSYYKLTGENEMLSDLDRLSIDQKELLSLMMWDMVISDGRPNEKEMQVTLSILDEIGITQEQFIKKLEKTKAMMDYFKL